MSVAADEFDLDIMSYEDLAITLAKYFQRIEERLKAVEHRLEHLEETLDALS